MYVFLLECLSYRLFELIGIHGSCQDPTTLTNEDIVGNRPYA